jgi:hypothetical protein
MLTHLDLRHKSISLNESVTEKLSSLSQVLVRFEACLDNHRDEVQWGLAYRSDPARFWKRKYQQESLVAIVPR